MSKPSVSVDDHDASRCRIMATILWRPVDRGVSHFRYIHGTRYIVGTCVTDLLNPRNYVH